MPTAITGMPTAFLTALAKPTWYPGPVVIFWRWSTPPDVMST